MPPTDTIQILFTIPMVEQTTRTMHRSHIGVLGHHYSYLANGSDWLNELINHQLTSKSSNISTWNSYFANLEGTTNYHEILA